MYYGTLLDWKQLNISDKCKNEKEIHLKIKYKRIQTSNEFQFQYYNHW